MQPETRLPIHTERLIIRPFRATDADDLYEYLSDPQTYVYEPGESITSSLASAVAADMATSPDFWAIEVAVTGKQIGQIYLKQVEPYELMTCELGYILNPRYQRQGFAAEAIAALVAYAFSERSMHRIYAHCNPENVASWKLLERIGFRREGLLRQNIFFRRDATGAPLWTDTFVYARLADESQTTPTSFMGES
jgi:[ribosomal protein S5]-alanine N-acetyltransferase